MVRADGTSPGYILDQTAINTVLNQVYPVGAIYLSTVSTSPRTLFGGTWTRITGKFLLAQGGGYSAGSTGGEATHTLTTNEMPAHKHTSYRNLVNTTGSGTSMQTASGSTYGTAYGTAYDTSEVGGGAAHNNMPPYLAVYVWKRTG